MQSNNYGTSSSMYLSSVVDSPTTTDQLNDHLNLINVFSDADDAVAGDIREIEHDDDGGHNSTTEYYHGYCDSSTSTSAAIAANNSTSTLPSCNYTNRTNPATSSTTAATNATKSASKPDFEKLSEIHPWMTESKNSKRKAAHKNVNNVSSIIADRDSANNKGELFLLREN